MKRKYIIVQNFSYYPLGSIKEEIVGKEFDDIEETIEFAKALQEEYGYNYIIDKETKMKVWNGLREKGGR